MTRDCIYIKDLARLNANSLSKGNEVNTTLNKDIKPDVQKNLDPMITCVISRVLQHLLEILVKESSYRLKEK